MSQDTSQNVTQDLSRAEALKSSLSDASNSSTPPGEDKNASETASSKGLAAVEAQVTEVASAQTVIESDTESVPTATNLDAQTTETADTHHAEGIVESSANTLSGLRPTVARAVALVPTSAREWLADVKLPPSPRAIRLLVGVCSALLLLALLPALLNASHRNVGATSAPPTATTVPTATPLPSPTAMPGYQPIVDGADGFVIQYPLTWTCSSSNPGIDCIDSPTAQNYRLQVQLPGSWTGADTGHNANDASVWVDYALSAFSDVPGRTYQRLADANQSAVIGGVTWSGGAALVGIEPDDGSNNTPNATATPTAPLVLIRVQVYATLYNNHPYIIALYAADSQFTTGSSRYFQPMLSSFAFLPTGNAS